MLPRVYVKRSTTVRAVRLATDNHDDVIAWLAEHNVAAERSWTGRPGLVITYCSGVTWWLDVGEWVMVDGDGQADVMVDEKFVDAYEEVG
ncbi:hypothetical protein ACIBH1_45290 [Nonomuraea sp. NPDC050663]|uniref:hypothetical protein n=1 Tax=Nonomuraea sp. NPDC050663 TaxID=3364370 RepID=UPI00378B7869